MKMPSNGDHVQFATGAATGMTRDCGTFISAGRYALVRRHNGDEMAVPMDGVKVTEEHGHEFVPWAPSISRP